MSELTQAQQLIQAVTEQAGDMENALIVYSRKGDKQGTVVLGMTGQTQTMWHLGALDYARWHIYNTMSLNRMADEMAAVIAADELANFADGGGKPS